MNRLEWHSYYWFTLGSEVKKRMTFRLCSELYFYEFSGQLDTLE